MHVLVLALVIWSHMAQLLLLGGGDAGGDADLPDFLGHGYWLKEVRVTPPEMMVVLMVVLMVMLMVMLIFMVMLILILVLILISILIMILMLILMLIFILMLLLLLT